MSKLNKKKTDERAAEMENGWEAEAPDIKFRKHSLADLKAKRQSIESAKQEAANIEAQLKSKNSEIDDLYYELDDMIVDVGEGVRGHDDYGSDSKLYGLMGFIRKSLRKSGLTRKSKNNLNGENK
jgi:hypothetical protein